MTIIESLLGGSAIFKSMQAHAGAYFIAAIIIVGGIVLNWKGKNDKKR